MTLKAMPVMNFSSARWRTGRKVGRTIYAMWGDDPSNEDVLIGLMDSQRIAEEAVNSHNLCAGWTK